MAKRRSRGQTPDGAKSRPSKTRTTPSRRRTRSSASGASDDTGSTPRGAAARSTPRRRSRRSVEPAAASGAGSGAGTGSGRRGSSGRGSTARGRGPGGKVLLTRHGQLEELETLFMTATSDFMASDQAKKLLRSAAQKRVRTPLMRVLGAAQGGEPARDCRTYAHAAVSRWLPAASNPCTAASATTSRS